MVPWRKHGSVANNRVPDGTVRDEYQRCLIQPRLSPTSGSRCAGLARPPRFTRSCSTQAASPATLAFTVVTTAYGGAAGPASTDLTLAQSIARKSREAARAALEDAQAKADSDGLGGHPPDGLWVPTIADASCQPAWEYETCEHQLATGLAGRRGGKTASNQRLSARLLAQRGKSVIYVSLVEKNAKEQFFLPLIDLLVDRGWRLWEDRSKSEGQWDFRADRSALILRTRWGSVLRAFSAHDMGTAATIRGYPADLLILDEAQEPRDNVVRYLMDRIASAFVIDRGGWVRMSGTVPAVEPCYFSEALDNDGWKQFTWTAFHHDLPKPRERKVADLQELCEAKKWALQLMEVGKDEAGRPISSCGEATAVEIASEFFAKRVKDPNTVLYSYDPAVNGEVAPEGYCDMFSVGLDLGWTDPNAINVRGWRSDDPLMRTWQIYEWMENEIPAVAPDGRPSIAKQLSWVLERWPAWQVVADDATGGDKITIATLAEILGIELTHKPRNLGVSVELYNEDFRCGRAHIDSKSATAEEIQHMRKVPDPNAKGWKFKIVSSRRRGRNADGTEGKINHKDHAAASRMAHWGARHYWNSVRPEEVADRKPFFEMTHEELQAERRRIAAQFMNNPMGVR